MKTETLVNILLNISPCLMNKWVKMLCYIRLDRDDFCWSLLYILSKCKPNFNLIQYKTKKLKYMWKKCYTLSVFPTTGVIDDWKIPSRLRKNDYENHKTIRRFKSLVFQTSCFNFSQYWLTPCCKSWGGQHNYTPSL